MSHANCESTQPHHLLPGLKGVPDLVQSSPEQ